jgi:hypothetical protein
MSSWISQLVPEPWRALLVLYARAAGQRRETLEYSRFIEAIDQVSSDLRKKRPELFVQDKTIRCPPRSQHKLCASRACESLALPGRKYCEAHLSILETCNISGCANPRANNRTVCQLHYREYVRGWQSRRRSAASPSAT